MTITIFITALLGSMALGMPIAFALMACGLALMWHLDMLDAQIIAQNLINGADSFPLMAVPFFMLAGTTMNAGGLSKRIIKVAVTLVGHIPGGLGYVVIIASCILASLSGSAAADAAAMSALLFPMMVKYGYDPKMSVGLISTGSIIGPMVPPSPCLILFGVISGLSITRLFLAAIVPGLMIAVALAITWGWVARGQEVKVTRRASLKEVLAAIREGLWALVMPGIIVFGLKFGIFTPTEAGSVCAIYALFVSIYVYKELKWSQVFGVLAQAGQTAAVVMFLVAAAMVSAWLIAIAEIPQEVIEMLKPFMGSPTLLMIAIMIITVIVGTALDMTPTILILTPVLVPVVVAAGIDPIYFGVLFIINNAIGLVTPPVGTTLNVVCGVTRRTMDEAIVAVIPFMIAQLIVLGLLVAFPQLVLAPMRWLLGL
jgi:tripartite ATP-independent transporter DctM subunit